MSLSSISRLNRLVNTMLLISNISVSSCGCGKRGEGLILEDVADRYTENKQVHGDKQQWAAWWVKTSETPGETQGYIIALWMRHGRGKLPPRCECRCKRVEVFIPKILLSIMRAIHYSYYWYYSKRWFSDGGLGSLRHYRKNPTRTESQAFSFYRNIPLVPLVNLMRLRRKQCNLDTT